MKIIFILINLKSTQFNEYRHVCSQRLKARLSLAFFFLPFSRLPISNTTTAKIDISTEYPSPSPLPKIPHHPKPTNPKKLCKSLRLRRSSCQRLFKPWSTPDLFNIKRDEVTMRKYENYLLVFSIYLAHRSVVSVVDEI